MHFIILKMVWVLAYKKNNKWKTKSLVCINLYILTYLLQHEMWTKLQKHVDRKFNGMWHLDSVLLYMNIYL